MCRYKFCSNIVKFPAVIPTVRTSVCRHGLRVRSLHWYPCIQYSLPADLQRRHEKQTAYLLRRDSARLCRWSNVGRRRHWLVYCQWHAVAANQLSYHHFGEPLGLFHCHLSLVRRNGEGTHPLLVWCCSSCAPGGGCVGVITPGKLWITPANENWGIPINPLVFRHCFVPQND